jgi:DNA-binding helix-hairpin-helix protein with protein kinase domain
MGCVSVRNEDQRKEAHQYRGRAPAKAARLAALEKDKRRKQLQHFLERFRIEDEQIPMFGDKTKMMLYNAGVLDASDVEERTISSIKGVGPKRVESLLQWRAAKEGQFRFDPTKPVDPRDLHALDQEFTQKAESLRTKLSGGPHVLRQSVSVWQA